MSSLKRVSFWLTTALVIVASLRVTIPLVLPDAAAFLLAMVCVWFLPGYFVEGIVFPASRELSLTRLPLWFVFGLFVWTLPATALQFVGGTWFHFHLIYLALLCLLWLASAWRRGKNYPPPTIASQQREWFFEASLLVLCALLALYVARGPRDADDWLYLQIAQQILGSEPFQLLQASEARYTLRYAFHVWLFTQAYMAEAFGIDLVVLVREILPALVAPLALLAFYAWAREFFRRAGAAFLAVIFFLLIAFTNITGSGWGSGLIARAAQDKFLVWLLVVPLALKFAWQFLNSGRRAFLVAYALALITGMWIHPVAVFLIPLALAGFALFNLISPVRFSRARWLALTLASAPAFGAPVVIRLTTLPEVFITSSPLVEAYIRLSEDRLWIFGNWYVINPALLAQSFIVFSLLLLILFAKRLWREPRLQFLWGSALVPLALLSNPFTARVLGELFTPWQLWRMTWNVPSAFLLAQAAVDFFDAQRAGIRRMRPAVAVYLVLAAALAVGVYEVNPTRWYSNLTKDHSLDAATVDMLERLRSTLPERANVLLPRGLTRYASAYTYRAVVMSNDAQKPEDARGQQIDRFYEPNADPKFLQAFLDFWQIEFAVVENDSPQARFLKTNPRATFLYQNTALSLYRVELR